MINLKSNSNRGITIVSLVITVIILLILSGTAIYNLNLSSGAGRLNNMVADIKLLKDEILLYYNKYQEIPTTERKTNINGTEYYEIDLSKLDNITLNFGEDYGKTDNLTDSSDVYLVDSNLNIYYLKGIENSGEVYHEA